MSLGLPTASGGERMPIIKYDARAGRLFRIDRAQNAAGQFESNPVEITPVFQAVFDLEHIEIGWLWFPSNAAPDMQLVPYGQPLPPRPSPNHAVGFRLNLQLGKSCGGDVREMASNAAASIKGMDALHDQYLAGVKANPGGLPVVRLASTQAVVSQGKQQSSTNYAPVWEIAAWVARPAGLTPEAVKAIRSGQTAEPAAAAPVQATLGLNGSSPPPAAAPPPPAPAPAPLSLADEF